MTLSCAPTRSSSANRMPAIDALRAIAMLMVFTYHVWQFAGEPVLFLAGLNVLHPISQFPSGVDLFMVLSGFCLSLPLMRPGGMDKWSWRKYAGRRAWRIIPPYYAAIAYCILLPQLLVVCFRLIGSPAKWQVIPAWWDILAHLTFTHTLFPQTWAGITGAFWSLGLEAQFYLTFPFVVWSAARWGVPRTVAILTAISLVYRAAASLLLANHSGDVRFLATIFFPGRWMQFALGMLAALVVSRTRGWSAGGRAYTLTRTLTGVAIAISLYVLANSSLMARIPLFPTRDLLLAAGFFCLIVTMSLSTAEITPNFAIRGLAALGFISYSIFLIHQPTAWFFSELCRRVLHVDGLSRFGLLMTVGLALVLLISAGFFWVCERPFLKRDGARRSPAPSIPIANNEPVAATASAAAF